MTSLPSLTWPFAGGATVSRRDAALKLAVTVLAASSVTEQVGAVPEQAPSQRSNARFSPGVAVSATTLPWSCEVTQLSVQAAPAPVTVPPPSTFTVSERCTGLKLAVAVLSPSISNLHEGVEPEQAPAQRSKR